ncbi:MAG: hypothetical protein K1X36_05580 [Pyrinomonadaceae bacterium]|nr:hypothetical protein [Pyrinomonadaceae bacterium]
MATKYDTNPLDPDFPEKAKAPVDATQTQTLPYTGAETNALPYAAPTEEQTRRFAEPDVRAYSQPYNGQFVPTQFTPAPLIAPDQSRTRKVEKIGLPENVMVALPYLPFSIGLVAGIIELLLVPRSEAKVRFHAAQGLAAHVAILIVTTILGVVDRVTDIAGIGNGIFTAVTTVMLIIFAVKAWKGKPVHIESIDDLTNWLDDKIKLK